MKLVTTAIAAAFLAAGTAAGALAQTPAAPAKPAAETAKPMAKEAAKPMVKAAEKPMAKGAEKPMAKKAEKPMAKKAAETMKKAPAHRATMSRRRVEEIQVALKRAGATKLAIDGYWGSATHAALVAFQKAHGLKATGHLDQATLKKLDVPHWKN